MIQSNILYTIQDNFRKALKENAHDDNFVISFLTRDGVYWKRKSDGKELVTDFNIFGDGLDPTEWKTESELSSYIKEIED